MLDREFPVEASLVPSIIELVVKELLGAEYRPKDLNNDATDDLSDIATFIKRNTKSEISKALE